VEPLSDPLIRQLGIDDLEGVCGLSTGAGWNQTANDWRMLFRLAPDGSFAAEADGRIVGSAIGIDYGSYGWIAMMLVEPAYRGRGIGGALLEAAMGAIRAELPIRLDATPLGRPLYQRHGFEEEATLTRYALTAPPGSRHERGNPDQAARAQRLTANDLKVVIEQDKETGRARRQLIEWAFDQAPDYCHVLHTTERNAQYCLGRRGRLFDQIGPVVAIDDEVADALVSAALSAVVARQVIVDAFDSHHAFAASLRKRGFEHQRPLYRMCRPARQPSAGSGTRRHAAIEFAIFGPEFS
jgi:ribosomal protein S18 acetylase RimI-like enzyme